jgi:hypothetical protein
MNESAYTGLSYSLWFRHQLQLFSCTLCCTLNPYFVFHQPTMRTLAPCAFFLENMLLLGRHCDEHSTLLRCTLTWPWRCFTVSVFHEKKKYQKVDEMLYRLVCLPRSTHPHIHTWLCHCLFDKFLATGSTSQSCGEHSRWRIPLCASKRPCSSSRLSQCRTPKPHRPNSSRSATVCTNLYAVSLCVCKSYGSRLSVEKILGTRSQAFVSCEGTHIHECI